MRRRIKLYIGSSRADIDDKGLILYNYAFTELQTPAAVKNSYSKQVTLPGTGNNTRIFGQYNRLDRTIGNGFDAGAKTPFTIYDEVGQILESGYVKLNEVQRRGDVVTGYKVTLYGGLGALFYALSYGPSGGKLTLADLDFTLMGIQMQPFTINASTVRAAWTRLRTYDQTQYPRNMWDVINFAPAYNGIPSGKFSAGKAVIRPASVGLPTSQVDGSDTYSVRDGLALLNLSKQHDEWAAKDLRSYLQRPVFSMRAFLEAVSEYALREGYEIEVPADVVQSCFVNVWKTLPAIPSLGTFKKISGNGSLSYEQDLEEGDYIADISVNGVPAGATQTVDMEVEPSFRSDGIPSSMTYTTTSGGRVLNRRLLTFVQCVAMNGSAMLGASPVKVLCGWTSRSGQGLAQAVGFTPWVQEPFEDPVGIAYSASAVEDYKISKMRFSLSAANATYYRIYFRSYILTTYGEGQDEYLDSYRGTGFGGFSGSSYVPADAYSLDSFSGSVYYETASDARSGAVVDPSVLLRSAHTPAEYLISFCKMHGLVFDYDPAAKKLTIKPRNTFFESGETEPAIDLSARIDRSKDIIIEPLALKSKWYELSQEMVEGAFAKQYQQTYGVRYGAQRINTGYDLDTAAVNLMDGLAFKGAVTVLDHSPYWNIITSGGNKLPSTFVDKGNTYTLWTSTGKTKEFQVPCPLATSGVTYYNTIAGYDKQGAGKLEFRDADNKALDGEDVLCRYAGYESYQDFAVTDDTAQMLAMNNDTPCWDFTVQAGHTENIPLFSRYDSIDPVYRSLDFGIPGELDYPGVNFDTEAGSLYLRYWRYYLHDLLNANTKVMRCKVDFTGMKVGVPLLGRFFWYGGALWVLNKINNYSLTTWDPVDCEFVQVQETGHYWDGQII